MSFMKERDIYTAFAPVYDRLMQHVEYKRWFRYIHDTWLFFLHSNGKIAREKAAKSAILEVGCGTGSISLQFEQKGYSIFNLDRSHAMLKVLRQKSKAAPYLFCADMRDFALKRSFDFIYCVHDTVNYLTEENDLDSFFQRVKEHLNDDGIFLFDITSEFNILSNFDQKEEISNFKDLSVTWSNRYDWEKGIITSRLDFNRSKSANKSKAANPNNIKNRKNNPYPEGGDCDIEYHQQRIYNRSWMESFLLKRNWKILGVYGDYSREKPDGSAIMLNFWLKKGPSS